MAFDFNTLEPLILNILSTPDIDLETISARRVRHQLPDLDASLTPQFLKENKDAVDAVIARVYEKVSAGRAGGSHKAEETEGTPELRKRKQENETEDNREYEDDEAKEPPQKKVKKPGKTELSDAELARKLNDEINSRSRRTTTKGRNGTSTRGGRTKKSSAIVNSDEDSGHDDGAKKPKKRSTGPAKGGFGKEYALRCFLILFGKIVAEPPFPNCSEPLAAVLNVPKLSRPQVVKQLWVYIKENGLQNPDNKREILCDVNLRAVFGVDKIDMFRMNKVLGQ